MFDREKWMLAAAISGVCQAANAPDCANDDETEATNEDSSYVKDVAVMVAERCSKMQIESLLDILNTAWEHRNACGEKWVGARNNNEN